MSPYVQPRYTVHLRRWPVRGYSNPRADTLTRQEFSASALFAGARRVQIRDNPSHPTDPGPCAEQE